MKDQGAYRETRVEADEKIEGDGQMWVCGFEIEDEACLDENEIRVQRVESRYQTCLESGNGNVAWSGSKIRQSVTGTWGSAHGDEEKVCVGRGRGGGRVSSMLTQGCTLARGIADYDPSWTSCGASHLMRDCGFDVASWLMTDRDWHGLDLDFYFEYDSFGEACLGGHGGARWRHDNEGLSRRCR